MPALSRISVALLGACLLLPARSWAAPPIGIVAGENMYGDVALQIAGPAAQVTSILSNPDMDPHLFEASASVARQLAGARIVVMNGVDYDPWLARLLAASPVSADRRAVITVASLVGARPGDNPHLWYDPATMPALAHALAAQLAAIDPAHAADFAARAKQFDDSLNALRDRIAALRTRFNGLPVTATEPVFGDMARALGLTMRNERFQLAVMNDTEPSAGDVAAFEADLRGHAVRLLIYNSQASDPAARRLLRIAKESGVPVVGVTETEPKGMAYQPWMQQQLSAVEHALDPPKP